MSFQLFRATSVALSSVLSSPTRRSTALHPVRAIVAVNLWTASVGNIALWRELARVPGQDNLRGLLFAIGLGLMIAAAGCVLLAPLAWRWTLKPVLTLYLMAAALGAHFMLAYGVVIDTTMMVNVLQTDPRETRDLLGWRLLLTVLLLGGLPTLWLWRTPLRRPGAFRRVLANAALALVSALLLAGTLMLLFQDFASVMRNNTQVRYLLNPLNSFYALADLAAQPLKRDSSVLLPLGRDAHPGAAFAAPARPPLLLLVLGETARQGNFSVNGYARRTTPELEQQNVLSLRNVWSCGTNTAASVPCMFSHLGREAFPDRKTEFENLIDVLQHAGLAVLWINNQSGCKGVCDRATHVDTNGLQVPGLCQEGECLDEVMLRDLDQRIEALPAGQRAHGVVLVLHQMGSHGPAYYKRSPAAFKRFLPECTSTVLQQCDREQVVNAYDNTIAYTDHFLNLSIAWLKQREARYNTALLYLADHGESLGENNLYLHGLPYTVAPDLQKRVPWITWLSPGFEQQRGLDRVCLQRNVDQHYSHDNYFHSVLGLLDIQTSVYSQPLDLYATCERH